MSKKPKRRVQRNKTAQTASSKIPRTIDDLVERMISDCKKIRKRFIDFPPHLSGLIDSERWVILSNILILLERFREKWRQ